MVPGIAEREIRHHANRRQEWLLSEAGSIDSSLLAERRSLRVTLTQALQAITNLRPSQASNRTRTGSAQSIVLETARR